MQVDIGNVKNLKAVSGKGLKADCLVCTDKHHCLGNRKFVEEEHEINDEILKKIGNVSWAKAIVYLHKKLLWKLLKNAMS